MLLTMWSHSTWSWDQHTK